MDLKKITKLIDRAHQLQVVQAGNFRLASGQTSDYYVDCNRLSLDSQSLLLIGQLVYQTLDNQVASIGGPAMGAIPLVVATLTQATGSQLSGFYMRQQSKDHGQLKQIEGRPKSPAVIIDDVCTSGGSLLQLAQQLQQQAVVVETMISLFDRGGGANIIKRGYNYISFISAQASQLQPYQSN